MAAHLRKPTHTPAKRGHTHRPRDNGHDHPPKPVAAVAKTPEQLGKALLAALNCQSSKDVTAVLNQGAAINANLLNARLDSRGYRALHIAAKLGDVQSIRILVRYRADVTTPNDDRVAPLLVALQNDRSDASLALLESYSTLMVKGSAGRLALHYAAEHRLVEPSKRLVALGADVNATDTKGETPLHFALHCKPGHVNLNILQLLLNAGARIKPAADGPSVIVAAFKGNHANSLLLMLEKGGDPNMRDPASSRKRYLLHLAAVDPSDFHTKVLQALLKNPATNVDVKDVNGDTPLHLAVEAKCVPAVTLLLKHGADPLTINKKGARATCRAAQHGSLRVLRLLFSKRAHRTMEAMYPPFVVAVLHRRFECAAFLLGLGLDINALYHGRRALHEVAGDGRANAQRGVEWLLGQGADRHLRAAGANDPVFRTPGLVGTAEEIARARRHSAVAKLLKEYPG